MRINSYKIAAKIIFKSGVTHFVEHDTGSKNKDEVQQVVNEILELVAGCYQDDLSGQIRLGKTRIRVSDTSLLELKNYLTLGG